MMGLIGSLVRARFYPVVRGDRFVCIDLNKENPELQNVELSNPRSFEKFLMTCIAITVGSLSISILMTTNLRCSSIFISSVCNLEAESGR